MRMHGSASPGLRLLLLLPVAVALARPAPGWAADATMAGIDGQYPASREASGTSWQPDSTPMQGLHDMGATWMTMWHGFVNVVEDEQGGPRGARESFSNSMLMFMGRRALDGGACGVHAMLSADPLMGPAGYPELFQTGETADGVHPLIDRQHPHNLLMEAAVSCSADWPDARSVFVYAGLAGEPALGPPAFMHRFSGVDDPQAPLTHHWLDSTHVTYGVVTGGYVWDRVKLEASSFNGREPDQHRYDVELRGFDSYAVRMSWNPTPDLAMQASTGRLASPEQLQPAVSVRRSTASVSYNLMLERIQWQSTVAFGRNAPDLGTASDAWLLESAIVVADSHTVFARAERVAKDELFLPGQPLFGPAYTIDSLSVGYIHDFLRFGAARFGIGGLLSFYCYPQALDAAYGHGPTSSLLFLRLRL